MAVEPIQFRSALALGLPILIQRVPLRTLPAPQGDGGRDYLGCKSGEGVGSY
jgi:hypothetical protein